MNVCFLLHAVTVKQRKLPYFRTSDVSPERKESGAQSTRKTKGCPWRAESEQQMVQRKWRKTVGDAAKCRIKDNWGQYQTETQHVISLFYIILNCSEFVVTSANDDCVFACVRLSVRPSFHRITQKVVDKLRWFSVGLGCMTSNSWLDFSGARIHELLDKSLPNKSLPLSYLGNTEGE